MTFFSSLNLTLMLITFSLWAIYFAAMLKYGIRIAIWLWDLDNPTEGFAVFACVFHVLWALPIFVDWKSGLVVLAITTTLEILTYRFLTKKKRNPLQYVDLLGRPGKS